MKSRRLKKAPSLSLKDHVLWPPIQVSKQENAPNETGERCDNVRRTNPEPALTRLPARPAILKPGAVCERARKKSCFCRTVGMAPELGVLRLRGSRLRCSLDERPRFLKLGVLTAGRPVLEAALAPTDFGSAGGRGGFMSV
jgi:hypothetical protein